MRVVRAANADVLVLGDVDYDLNGVVLAALSDQIGDYPHRYAKQPNRGLQTGRDLDGDGRIGGPGDAEGYGEFPGQGGLAVFSRFPIEAERVRDFTASPWVELPDNLSVGDGRDPVYMSTTAHWDVPVTLPSGSALHLLVWHGTAPVFDGPEDRNGRRNHDETRFWQLYLEGRLAATPPRDFVLTGTANSDPFDGESRPEALRALLAHPLVGDPRPASEGGVAAAAADGGANEMHVGPAKLDTVDWLDEAGDPGNLRVDYVLPAAHMNVAGSGVLWPLAETSLGRDVRLASRHRLVWVDLQMSDRRANRGERVGRAELR